MPTDPSFALNGSASALLTIGSLIGALAGAIMFLFKQLVDVKNAQIRDLQRDKDYWQSMALGMLGPAERAITLAEHSTRVRRHDKD